MMRLKTIPGGVPWDAPASVKNSARSRFFSYFLAIVFYEKNAQIRFLLVVWLSSFLYGSIFELFREVEIKCAEGREGYGCDRDR